MLLLECKLHYMCDPEVYDCRVPKCPTALNVRQILFFSKNVIMMKEIIINSKINKYFKKIISDPTYDWTFQQINQECQYMYIQIEPTSHIRTLRYSMPDRQTGRQTKLCSLKTCNMTYKETHINTYSEGDSDTIYSLKKVNHNRRVSERVRL